MSKRGCGQGPWCMSPARKTTHKWLLEQNGKTTRGGRSSLCFNGRPARSPLELNGEDGPEQLLRMNLPAVDAARSVVYVVQVSCVLNAVFPYIAFFSALGTCQQSNKKHSNLAWRDHSKLCPPPSRRELCSHTHLMKRNHGMDDDHFCLVYILLSASLQDGN